MSDKEKTNKGKGQAQSAESRSKPNRGQDENLHTLLAPDGTTIQATQREFKDTYRDQGYVHADPEDDVTVEKSGASGESTVE
jgi:hypothetical protein